MRIKIKNKIKDLLEEKNVNKTELSVKIGKEKSFISSIFSQSNKFFNLEHIEKICAALNYPVAKLFEDDAISPEEAPSSQANPKTPLEEAFLGILRGLSPKHKGDLIGYAEELRLTEVIPRRKLKKVDAAP